MKQTNTNQTLLREACRATLRALGDARRLLRAADAGELLDFDHVRRTADLCEAVEAQVSEAIQDSPAT